MQNLKISRWGSLQRSPRPLATNLTPAVGPSGLVHVRPSSQFHTPCWRFLDKTPGSVFR